MSEGYEETSQLEMQAILDRQRTAYLAEGVVSSQTRIDRLERAGVRVPRLGVERASRQETPKNLCPSHE